MKDKKNIDRLFQEKFKDFEKTPPEGVWTTIEQKLTGKKRDRAAFPLWSKIAGVAALLALLFIVGKTWFFNEQGSSVVKSSETPDSIEQPLHKLSRPASEAFAPKEGNYVKTSDPVDRSTGESEPVVQKNIPGKTDAEIVTAEKENPSEKLAA